MKKIYILLFAMVLLTTQTSTAQQLTIPDTSYTIEYVNSKDGTKIGYRHYGHGPGVVLVQGAMGVTYNYHQLAKALANDFTVYVPERRGRKLSPKEYTPNHTIERDVEDLNSVLEKTGAHFVFGLSSGAIITLEATRVLPTIYKAAIYEPPFYVNPVPIKKIERVFKEIEQGKTTSAMVSAFKIVKVGPSFFNFAPRFILKAGTKSFLKSEEKNGVGEYEYTRVLLPSMRFDFKVVLDRAGKLFSFNTVSQQILLLGGSKSPKYLKQALSALETVLPKASRKEFKELDHNAPWNKDKGGSPEIIAHEITTFFKGQKSITKNR